MKKNVIVYGYSVLGSKIANLLREKNYVVLVVDYNQTNLDNASSDGFETFFSTLLNDNDLIDIKIPKEIDSLFCVSDSNKNNLFVTLSARNLNKDLKIISISKTKTEAKKLQIAGATKVLNPNELGAHRIYRHMSKPIMLRVLDEILFSKSDLSISEIYITKNSLLNGKYLKDMQVHKRYNILLIGIMDKELGDKFIFNTKGINHKIDEGDILVVVGRNKDLEDFTNSINGIQT